MQHDPSAWRSLDDHEVRLAQTAVLKSLARYCRDNDLTFYLCAGTLLGSIRHAGFIPWDDDIDIMMPRDDYERLLEQFEALRSVTGLSVHALSTDEHWNYPFAKVTDDQTIVVEESDLATSVGLGVDVFPVDNWLSSHRGNLQMLGLRALRRVFSVKATRRSPKRSKWKNTILLAGQATFRPVRGRWIGVALNRVGSCARERSGATYAGVMVWDYRERVPVAAYGKHLDGQFEGELYPIPRDSDLVLRTLYGDYMQLPPPESQRSHHEFRAYRIKDDHKGHVDSNE